MLLSFWANGCQDSSKVCIPAISNANIHFVVLEEILADNQKNLQSHYEDLVASSHKKIMIDDNTLMYTLQNKSPAESYKNFVIVKVINGKLEQFFCFWADFKKKELMYLIEPDKYIKLIDKEQWGKGKNDSQLQNSIFKFIENKEFEPEKLITKQMYYHDTDKGERPTVSWVKPNKKSNVQVDKKDLNSQNSNLKPQGIELKEPKGKYERDAARELSKNTYKIRFLKGEWEEEVNGKLGTQKDLEAFLIQKNAKSIVFYESNRFIKKTKELKFLKEFCIKNNINLYINVPGSQWGNTVYQVIKAQ